MHNGSLGDDVAEGIAAMSPLADPADSCFFFWGGASFGGGLTYPHFQVSPRIFCFEIAEFRRLFFILC